MAVRIKEPEEVTLNLIPIMNLFTALIPFLLLSAAFFHLAIIKISVPVVSETGDTDIAKEEDKITLNLNILKDKFELSASSDVLTTAQKAKLFKVVQRPQNPDKEARKATLEQLSKKAKEIKGSYTASDTVIIVADGDIPYEEVIEAMDAVREITVERAGIKSRVTLFPKVVLSSIFKG